MAEQTDPNAKPPKVGGGIVTMLFGLLMIAASYWIYQDLAKWEEEGGRRRMNAIFLLLYNIAGKGPAALLITAVGVCLVVGGILTIIKASRPR